MNKSRPVDFSKRILAIVLTVVSCLLLLANWLVTKGNSKYDFSEYGYAVQGILEDVEEYAEYFDIGISTKEVRSIANSILDGKFKPVEIVRVGMEGNKIINKLKKNEWIDLEEDLGEISGIRTIVILYVIFFFLVILIGILRIIKLIRNGADRIKDWGFFVIQLVHLIFFIVISIYAKKEGLHLGLTAWPFIACVCALPFALINRIPSVDFTGIMATAGNGISRIHPAANTWTCSNCGKKNDSTSLFCSTCGKKKPEKTVCRNCGEEVDELDSFCKKCGARIVKKEETMVCPACGVRISSASQFCGFCGANLKEIK